MKFESIARNLRILWRADAIIAQIQLHNLLVRFGWRAFAALIAAFGLLALEIGAYFMLVQQVDVVLAAGLLGVSNFVLALVIVLLSARSRSGQDMQLALDLHKAAVEALQGEAHALQTDIESIRTVLSRPLDSALAGLAVPAISLLVRTLKNKAN